MEPIEYVFAAREDIDLMVESRLDFLISFNPKYAKEDAGELRESLRIYFEKSLNKGEYISWIAKSGSEFAGIGGMVIYKRPGNFLVSDGITGYIINMYTVPQFRKLGIATAILNKLVESGKDLGVSFFELHASQQGEPIYLKQGFHLHNQPTYRKWLAPEDITKINLKMNAN